MNPARICGRKRAIQASRHCCVRLHNGGTYPTPRSLFARGWTRPPSKGFIRINKIKEKIIYFFSLLCINYNNRSPAVGNDMIAKTALIAVGGPP
jgi:hypothetical protein